MTLSRHGRDFAYVGTSQSTHRPLACLSPCCCQCAPWDHALLGPVASRIVNEVRGINRVTYDITGKPPGTTEWE
jgi:GMP synthase PP-ATPase subunit